MPGQTDIAHAQALLHQQDLFVVPNWKLKAYFTDENGNDFPDRFEQRLRVDEAVLRNYQAAITPGRSFGVRLRAFFAATSTAGRRAKMIKDFAVLFLPFGRRIETVTEFISERFIKPEQNEEPDMNWFKNRLSEKSTWRGIIAVAAAVGITLSPEQSNAIVVAGVAVAGVFEAFFKEPQSADAKN